MLIANGSTEEEISAFSEAYDRIGTMVTRVPYLGGSSVPGYGDVDIQIVESGIGDEWAEMRTKYITGEIDRGAMDKFLAEELVPAYQPLMDRTPATTTARASTSKLLGPFQPRGGCGGFQLHQ